MTTRSIVNVFLAALALSAAACFHAAAFVQDVEVIDIPVLYEIDAHPDYGFFGSVLSVSMDNSRGAVVVLHDTPASLAAFNAEDGISLEEQGFKTRVEAPASAEVCDGKTWVISGRRLFLMGKDGSLNEPGFMKDAGPVDLDIAKCGPGEQLVLADSKKRDMYLLSADGALLPIDASGLEGRKFPPPNKLFASITDIAFGQLNSIFVLDRKGGVIRVIDNSGRLLQSMILPGPTGSGRPWDISSIALDSAGNIWAVNITENSLDAYDSFGSLLFRVKDFDESLGDFRFTRPSRIVIDRDDRVFVSDDAMFKVIVFDVSEI